MGNFYVLFFHTISQLNDIPDFVFRLFSLSLLIEFSMKMDRLWVDISFGSNDTLSLVVGCIESRSLEQQNSQQPNSIIDLL